MSKFNNQKGVGLTEVLVALILLAIGVLGYVALQLRAVDASNEAVMRSQSIILLRGLAESIRVNPLAQEDYAEALQTYSKDAIEEPDKLCVSDEVCTPSEMAAYDAYHTALSVSQLGIRLTMADCPGVEDATNKRQCIFAAWGETALDGDDYSDCMSDTGIYAAGSTCAMMEAY